MLKEAINRILELAAPNTVENKGYIYVDKNMSRLPGVPTANPLAVNTLTAITDYITYGVDAGALDKSRYVVHIEDFNEVHLYKELNGDKQREHLLSAHINNCQFSFKHFMGLEEFIISLQAHFVRTEQVKNLLALVGNIVSESGITHTDDGFTQRVTARTGIAIVGTKEVPNPVLLEPYRTFTEIEQPESAFVIRIRKEGDGGVTCALFEADGEAWKREAIQRISQWFKENLRGPARDNTILLA